LYTASLESKNATIKPDIMALYKMADSLDNLDKLLSNCLKLRSQEQAAWINMVKPTVCQAKAEADQLTQQTQREFFIRPAQIVPHPHGVQIDKQHPVTGLTAVPGVLVATVSLLWNYFYF
jgi:hypothetical protein